MWQLQYSINDEKGRFEYDLNPNALIVNGKKINGRFELYPTQNIYNFILLDKINGKTCRFSGHLTKKIVPCFLSINKMQFDNLYIRFEL